MTILLAKRQRGNQYNEGQLEMLLLCCINNGTHRSSIIDSRVIICVSPSNATATLFQYTRRLLAHSRFQTLKRSRLQIQRCETMHAFRSKQACFVCHNTHLRHSPGVPSLSHLGSGEPVHSETTRRRQMVQGLQANWRSSNREHWYLTTEPLGVAVFSGNERECWLVRISVFFLV